MVATVLDVTFFCSQSSESTLELGTQIKSELPKMLPNEEIEDVLRITETSMQSGA